MSVLSFKDYLDIAFFSTSNRTTAFRFHNFHLKICDYLQRYFQGSTRNLAIHIPPRYGKTTIAHYFMAYGLTYLPDANYIYTSYSAKLSEKAVTTVQDILTTQKHFGLDVACDDWRVHRQDEIRNTAGGGILGVSVGKAITGFGAGQKREGFSGAIIIDDPIKVQDIRSEVYRNKVIDYYVGTLKSRKNSANIPTILIAQRLHTEDLAGWIKENEPDNWDFIEFEGVNEDGSSVWEEVISTESLALLKEQSPFTYYSQYMQTPIIDGGEVVKRSWFNYFEGEHDYEYRFTVSDTAFKTKTANDYTVIMNVGFTKDNRLHIIDVYRGKWEFNTTQSKVREAYYENDSSVVYIEDRASGTPLAQVFKDERIPVKAVQPRSMRASTNDKYTRLMEVIEHITIGNVYLRENGGWVKEFLNECDCFRSDFSHAHDDQIDTLVYALQVYAKRRKSAWLKNL